MSISPRTKRILIALAILVVVVKFRGQVGGLLNTIAGYLAKVPGLGRVVA